MNNITKNYNKEKINYEILYNIKFIEDIFVINDIDIIINENNIKTKFDMIFDIYNK